MKCQAFVYQAQGKYAEAEPIFLRAFETRKGDFRNDYPQLATHLPVFFENWNEPSIYYFRNQPGVECYRFTTTSVFGRGHFVRIIRNLQCY